ncbi:MAG: glycosyltransferase family 2 protein [Bacteroidota bacterium]
MKVAGFTFIRNAVRYDYPVIESITSLLPLVDELVVCVGDSTDGTLALINGIGSPKIKIIHSVWDDALREGGKILAVETNKALAAVASDADWCFYLQGDEVLHEEDYQSIREGMLRYKDDVKVEGLLFNYRHFYGSYQYLGNSRKWYRHEIRIIRNHIGVYSYKDAQGFRIEKRKLNVKSIDAYIYHYGWVKNPHFQTEKQKSFHKLWHSDETVKNMVQADEYDYNAIDSLALFAGNHPAVMANRISAVDWDFQFDVSKVKVKFKYRILNYIEKVTGHRLFEYKNYHKI